MNMSNISVEEKLEMLMRVRSTPELFLPMPKAAWKIYAPRATYGEVNIGWDAGILEKNRPYFCECWAEGVTVVTYKFSALGIEDYTTQQLEEYLERNHIIRYTSPRKYKTSVAKFTDDKGNVFFSVNYVVGDDDGTYTEGGAVYSYKHLNMMNRRWNEGSDGSNNS